MRNCLQISRNHCDHGLKFYRVLKHGMHRLRCEETDAIISPTLRRGVYQARIRLQVALAADRRDFLATLVDRCVSNAVSAAKTVLSSGYNYTMGTFEPANQTPVTSSIEEATDSDDVVTINLNAESDFQLSLFECGAIFNYIESAIRRVDSGVKHGNEERTDYVSAFLTPGQKDIYDVVELARDGAIRLQKKGYLKNWRSKICPRPMAPSVTIWRQ